MIAVTLYQLKPRFQKVLRPVTACLHRARITANHVTVTALAGSILVGGLVAAYSAERAVFLLVPAWLLIRMALNAIDGMLARDFNQKSALGAYLNEICDVVSDAALYLPFALLAPFHPLWVVLAIVLSGLSEFAGALGPLAGASRRYDGPMGKSDRALVFGALGLAAGLAPALPTWLMWAMPVLAVLLCITTCNRIRAGVREAGHCV